MDSLTTEQWRAQFEAWRAKYTRYQGIADRVAKMRNDRARAACRAAGLDPSLLGIHPHNAMCGYRSGKPWPGVNYSLVRRCLWLLSREFEGSEIVRGWDRRVRGY